MFEKHTTKYLKNRRYNYTQAIRAGANKPEDVSPEHRANLVSASKTPRKAEQSGYMVALRQKASTTQGNVVGKKVSSYDSTCNSCLAYNVHSMAYIPTNMIQFILYILLGFVSMLLVILCICHQTITTGSQILLTTECRERRCILLLIFFSYLSL